MTTFFLGRPAEARVHLEAALAAYDAERHGSLALLNAFDQRVVVLAYLALALWQLGHPDGAAAQGQEALARARDLRHPMSLAYALQHACFFHQIRGDAEALAWHADALLSLAAEQAFPYWSAYAAFSRGLALTWRGQAEEGMAAAAKGMGAFRAVGAELGVPRARPGGRGSRPARPDLRLVHGRL